MQYESDFLFFIDQHCNGRDNLVYSSYFTKHVSDIIHTFTLNFDNYIIHPINPLDLILDRRVIFYDFLYF